MTLSYLGLNFPLSKKGGLRAVAFRLSAGKGALRRVEWGWLGQHAGKEPSQEVRRRSSIRRRTLGSGPLCMAYRGNGVGGVVALQDWGMASGVE